MSQPLELTLEQQFSLQSFKQQVENLDRDDAIKFLVELYTQKMVQENIFKQLIKGEYGYPNLAFKVSDYE